MPRAEESRPFGPSLTPMPADSLTRDDGSPAPLSSERADRAAGVAELGPVPRAGFPTRRYTETGDPALAAVRQDRPRSRRGIRSAAARTPEAARSHSPLVAARDLGEVPDVAPARQVERARRRGSDGRGADRSSRETASPSSLAASRRDLPRSAARRSSSERRESERPEITATFADSQQHPRSHRNISGCCGGAGYFTATSPDFPATSRHNAATPRQAQ